MKKLISILALTAVVANLGLATVFAATNSPAGTQEITCNNNSTGSQSLTVTTQDATLGQTASSEGSVAFLTKNVDWYNTLNTNAPLTVLTATANAQFINIAVEDNRGYDPSDDIDNVALGGKCGFGADYTITSNSLTHSVDPTKHLYLEVAAGISALDDTHFNYNASPATVSPDQTTMKSTIFTTPIVGATDLTDGIAHALFSVKEAFLGRVDVLLTGDDLQVIEPTGPIRAGTYAGNITITQTMKS